MKKLIVLIIIAVALLFSGCNLITPGTDEPSAKVVITSVSGYLWQTKGARIELSPILGDGLSKDRAEFTLSLFVNPEGSGSVTGGGSYDSGKKVEIKAYPINTCYVFVNWTSKNITVHNANSSTNAYVNMLGKPATVTANFKKCCEDGEQGLTPYIGGNGNWWIGDDDTGVPATGEAGNTPYIQDGNWWIDGADTGIPATGDQGTPGIPGLPGATGPQGPAGQDCTLPDSIYVYYTITNTGNVNIQEYTIYFNAETNNGVYTDNAIGEDLTVGATVYSYVKIDVFGNEVTFIDYSFELK